jgi:hypothetical protein
MWLKLMTMVLDVDGKRQRCERIQASHVVRYYWDDERDETIVTLVGNRELRVVETVEQIDALLGLPVT